MFKVGNDYIEDEAILSRTEYSNVWKCIYITEGNNAILVNYASKRECILPIESYVDYTEIEITTNEKIKP